MKTDCSCWSAPVCFLLQVCFRMARVHKPLWPNGQGACLRSRRFTVRVRAVVTESWNLGLNNFVGFSLHSWKKIIYLGISSSCVVLSFSIINAANPVLIPEMTAQAQSKREDHRTGIQNFQLGYCSVSRASASGRDEADFEGKKLVWKTSISEFRVIWIR